MECGAELQVDQPSAENHPTVPISPADEVQEVPPRLLKGLSKQVIEGDQEPAIRAAESDKSIEQIDNPDGILDRQE